MDAIPNSELTLERIPPPDADWNAIQTFALTFDGYKEQGSFQACAEIANGHLTDTLTNARTCLFFEQRRWRHFGDEPDEESMKYIREVMRQIRKFVRKSEGAKQQ